MFSKTTYISFVIENAPIHNGEGGLLAVRRVELVRRQELVLVTPLHLWHVRMMAQLKTQKIATKSFAQMVLITIHVDVKTY